MADDDEEFDSGLIDFFNSDRISPEFEDGINSRRKRIASPKPQEETIEVGHEYVIRIKQEDEKKAMESAAISKQFHELQLAGNGDPMSNDDKEELEPKKAVYDMYSFERPPQDPTDNALPINCCKDEILKALKSNRVIIIKGATGCGKSTCVPQYILDDYAARKAPCNILVTQPRRIAAISISRRINRERRWVPGTVVGYHIGMEKELQSETCLTFMTTGCLLEKMIARRSLAGITHIIIDEVHERDEDTDMLMLLIRHLIIHPPKGPSPITKLILMSATMQPESFQEYFKVPSVKGEIKMPALINADKPTGIPLHVYYLDYLRNRDKLQSLLNADSSEPTISDDFYKAVAILISEFEEHEQNKFGRSRDHGHLSTSRDAVLVFLPGLSEIETMQNFLQMHEEESEKRNLWEIVVLHSQVTGDEQSRAFETASQDHRKIILATNIAESSITIPDIVYVIDFCLMKQVYTDRETNFTSLKTLWASKVNCEQRKGRVGRCKSGIVYRMVSSDFYELLEAESKPEILRCSLEHTILRSKCLNIGQPKEVLARALSPPDMANIVETVYKLKEVGALMVTTQGKFDKCDGDLTYMGRILAKLPVDVRLGRLIMLGYMFNVLEECIIMAAGMASKSIFELSRNSLPVYESKLRWSGGSFSDPITMMNVYNGWKSNKRNEREWARDNKVQLKSLKEIHMLVKNIKFRLQHCGIESPTAVEGLSPSDVGLVLRVVLFGAFYMQYFTRTAHDGGNDKGREKDAYKAYCCMDPFTTVKLNRFPVDWNPKAYYVQIKNQLQPLLDLIKVDTWDADIKVDSTRVFLTFHQRGNPEQIKRIPGRIPLPVYLAVKLGQIGRQFHLAPMADRDIERYLTEADSMSVNLSRVFNAVPSSDLPQAWRLPIVEMMAASEELVPVTVSHVDNAGHFWVQRVSKADKADYNQMKKIIGVDDESGLITGHQLTGAVILGNIMKDSLVMAPFLDEYYRAKVLDIRTEMGQHKILVYFIDFGNAAEYFASELRKMPEALLQFHPLAIECKLKGAMPSPLKDVSGMWHPDADSCLREHFVDRQSRAKIYSVVNGVMSCDLFAMSEEAEPLSLWSFYDRVVAEGWAVPVDESYVSDKAHEERMGASASADYKLQAKHALREVNARKAEMSALQNCRFNISSAANEHSLLGPDSVMNMRMWYKGTSRSGIGITVDPDSVNSVLLDDQPSDKHERILIAAQVGKSKEDKVNAHHTTLLPNIHGLPAILTLLFAPRAEYRCDRARSRLTGAVCGLGFNPETNRAVYEKHDMTVDFDCEFHTIDAKHINMMRYLMNDVLGTPAFDSEPLDPGVRSKEKFIDADTKARAPNGERILEYNTKMLTLLFRLLRTPRREVEMVMTRSGWNALDRSHFTRSSKDKKIKEEDLAKLQLFPSHKCIKLANSQIK